MSHIPRIWIDTVLAVGERFDLPGDKAHHLTTVLRLREGAQLQLFNGDGHEYTATVAAISRNAAAVGIDAVDTPRRESPLNITLAQGIVRGDRMDFAIAKAVELGANAIQPLLTARGQVRLQGPRLQKKQKHWQRVAESAAEQSGRLVRPTVQPAHPLPAFLKDASDDLQLVLAPASGTPLSQVSARTSVTVLIGPESGLSDNEIETARQAGFVATTLGPRILRTETAGMATLAALQSLWGDLG